MADGYIFHGGGLPGAVQDVDASIGSLLLGLHTLNFV